MKIDASTKEQEQGIFLDKSLNVFGLVAGEPGIIRRGTVLPTPLPDQQWGATKADMLEAGVWSLFDCPECSQPVMTFRAKDLEAIIQTCQCTVVSHLNHAGIYTSPDQWRSFQSLYASEAKRPVPRNGMDMDPFTGHPMKLNARGKAYLKKRLGLSQKIDISDDGTVFTYGDSSMSVDSATGIQSVIYGKDETEAAFLTLSIAAAKAANGVTQEEDPPVMVYLGTDPDYVWPEGTPPDRITSLPFRCPNCSARVKRMPLKWGLIDEMYECFCAAVTFQRSAARPRSSGEWRDLQILGQTVGVKHRAKIARGNS